MFHHSCRSGRSCRLCGTQEGDPGAKGSRCTAPYHPPFGSAGRKLLVGRHNTRRRSLLGTPKLFFVTHRLIFGESSLGGYPKRITAGQLYSAGSLNTGPLDPTGVHCKRGKSTTRTPYGVTALGHCHVHTSHHSAADHSETLQRLTRDPYLVLTRHS